MTAPMNPADVPAETLNAFKTAGHAAMMTPGAPGDLSDRYLAGGLAAVIPAIRAQVADEIARDICEPMDDCDRPSCPDCIRHEYAQRLARRIRGDQ